MHLDFHVYPDVARHIYLIVTMSNSRQNVTELNQNVSGTYCAAMARLERKEIGEVLSMAENP